MFIYDMFTESVDIFLMEANASSNHDIRMAEIAFMENGDNEIFTESVVDSVKDFVDKIVKKIKELLQNLQDKIAEKLTEAKVKKAVTEFRKLNAEDIQKIKNKKMSWLDWKKFDKKMTECCNDYKKIAARLNKMKIDSPEDAKRFLDELNKATDEFNQKYQTGTADDFITEITMDKVAGSDMAALTTKYFSALKASMLRFNTADDNVTSSVGSEKSELAMKTKAEAIRKIVSVKLSVLKKWMSTYGAIIGGTLLSISGVVNGIGAAIKEPVSTKAGVTTMNAAFGAGGVALANRGIKNLREQNL